MYQTTLEASQNAYYIPLDKHTKQSSLQKHLYRQIEGYKTIVGQYDIRCYTKECANVYS